VGASKKSSRKIRKRSVTKLEHAWSERINTVSAIAIECSITTRQQVSQVVLDFLHGKGFQSATEDSDFEHDIRVTSNARRAWAFSLRDIIESRGCEPSSFGPDACANAEKVGDMVDALAEALRVS
jgi:hypothetical protein